MPISVVIFIVLDRFESFFVNLLKHQQNFASYTFILKIKLKTILLVHSCLESCWLVIAFIFCQSQHMAKYKNTCLEFKK